MTDQDITILCVDDEANVLKALRRLFLDEDYEIITAESGEEGLEELDNEPGVQVVISDYRMPGMNGVDFLKEVYARRPDTVRIVLSGYADTASIVSAINDGQIYKFIPKPWNDDELRVTIANAIELYFLQKENSSLSKDLQDANEELKIINQNLEKMVEERSQELLFQNRVLAKAQFILDSLPVGVLGVDLNDMIVQFNRRSAELLGCPGLSKLGTDAGNELPAELTSILNMLHDGGQQIHKEVTLDGKQAHITGVYMQGEEGQEGKILVLSTPQP